MLAKVIVYDRQGSVIPISISLAGHKFSILFIVCF